MDMLDVHHIAIYDDLIAAKVQGCTSLVFSERASRISIKISSIIRLFQFQVLQITDQEDRYDTGNYIKPKSLY